MLKLQGTIDCQEKKCIIGKITTLQIRCKKLFLIFPFYKVHDTSEVGRKIKGTYFLIISELVLAGNNNNNITTN